MQVLHPNGQAACAEPPACWRLATKAPTVVRFTSKVPPTVSATVVFASPSRFWSRKMPRSVRAVVVLEKDPPLAVKPVQLWSGQDWT